MTFDMNDAVKMYGIRHEMFSGDSEEKDSAVKTYVKRRYRQLAKELHTDSKGGGDRNKFELAKQFYETVRESHDAYTMLFGHNKQEKCVVSLSEILTCSDGKLRDTKGIWHTITEIVNSNAAFVEIKVGIRVDGSDEAVSVVHSVYNRANVYDISVDAFVKRVEYDFKNEHIVKASVCERTVKVTLRNGMLAAKVLIGFGVAKVLLSIRIYVGGD